MAAVHTDVGSICSDDTPLDAATPRYANAHASAGTPPGNNLRGHDIRGALVTFAHADGTNPSQRFSGVAASCGGYTGVARVVRTTEHVARLEPGDVLVTCCEFAIFNSVLMFLGAIVADRGGALCNLASSLGSTAFPLWWEFVTSAV